MNYAAMATDLLEAGVTMPAGCDPVDIVRRVVEAEQSRAWDTCIFDVSDDLTPAEEIYAERLGILEVHDAA